MSAIHAVSFSRPWSQADLESSLSDSSRIFRMAETAEQPAGFIVVQLAADQSEIMTLAIDPAFRRRGLGAALVETALKVARERGAKSLWLDVSEENRAARSLYGRLGFCEDGRRKGYYSGVDAILLSRRLD